MKAFEFRADQENNVKGSNSTPFFYVTWFFGSRKKLCTGCWGLGPISLYPMLKNHPGCRGTVEISCTGYWGVRQGVLFPPSCMLFSGRDLHCRMTIDSLISTDVNNYIHTFMAIHLFYELIIFCQLSN